MSSDFQNRLRKNLERPAPTQHPAPDVLNAYVEHALTPPEERQVVEHLAACSECREVVYLASEAVEEPVEQLVAAAAAAPAPAPTPPSRRFRWWTWALPVAAVLVVASVVLVLNPRLSKKPAFDQYAQSKQPEPQPEPKTAPAPTADAPAKEAPVATLTAPSTDAVAGKRRQLQAVPAPTNPRDELAKDKAENQPAKSRLAEGDDVDLKADVTGREEKTLSTAKPASRAGAASGAMVASAPVAPPPAPAQVSPSTTDRGDTTVDVASEAPMLDAQSSNEIQEKVAKQNQKTDHATAGSMYASSAGNLRAKKIDAAPLWTVTDAGRLMHLELGRSQPALADSGTHFIAVTSLGTHVWAAGKKLALYHSADGGLTWEHQTVPAKSNADIVAITFKSVLEGVLETNSGSAFATHDGGKTWLALDTKPASTPQH